MVAQLQLSDEREADVRLLFKKRDQNPKILIVTDKLLTGYDAPLLYCMYLDKPMRDQVLPRQKQALVAWHRVSIRR